MTRFFTLMIAATAALAIPTVAAAAPKPEEPQATTSTQEAPTTNVRRYCIVDRLTGTRMQKRVCKPLDGWLAQGIDPRETK